MSPTTRFTTSITLGHLDSRQHEAAAAAVLRVLEAHEMEVAMVAANRETMIKHIAGGRIDLLATAWLPEIDAAWADPAYMETLGGVVYRPLLLWAVPTAAGLTGLDSIADLARPEIAGSVDRVVVLSRRLETHGTRVMQLYGLDAAGYRLEVVDNELAYASAARALDGATPTVLPLWQPHALAHRGRMRVLDDPKQALGGRREAKLLLRTGLRETLDPDLVDELDELTLGNPVVSALEYAMRNDGMTADEAAEAWQRGKLTPRA